MAPKKETVSELLQAATELDAALRRFGERTEALRIAPLDSQKHMKRAGQLFQELGALEPEMAGRVQAMAATLLATRTAQEKWVETIQARATEYQARATLLEQLLLGYRALGEGVGKLNEALRGIPADAPPGVRTARIAETLDGMRMLEDAAQKLAQRCNNEAFRDVGRQVEALRQQLIAATKQLSRVASVPRQGGPDAQGGVPDGDCTDSPIDDGAPPLPDEHLPAASASI